MSLVQKRVQEHLVAQFQALVAASGASLERTRPQHAGQPATPQTRRIEVERVVLVTRQTALEELLVRFGTRGQARFYLTHAGDDFGAIEAAHERYHGALRAVREQLPRRLKVQVVERALLAQYQFAPTDLALALGPDGLVVNVAKYLDGQPIVGVNPDPARIEGVLLRVALRDAGKVVQAAAAGEVRTRAVTMAEAATSDGQRLLAFNDLFVGAKTHVSARYRLRVGRASEAQSSSGIIVSTGAGSTGWLRSVLAGAAGVARARGVRMQEDVRAARMPWGAPYLTYAVREPFPSTTTGANLVMGQVTHAQPLVVESHMATGGVVFSDGMEADFLRFDRGATVTIRPAAQQAHLVVGERT
ncbi:MAG: hypothetical protein AAF624_04245 [Bacteroidota bacterium]